MTGSGGVGMTPPLTFKGWAGACSLATLAAAARLPQLHMSLRGRQNPYVPHPCAFVGVKC